MHKPLISRVHHLIVVQLFMLGHPGNEGRHVGDAGYHFIHDIVEVATVAEVQWGVKGHLTSAEHQLDLKERCDALGCVCIVHEVLQGAAYCTAEAREDHAVHVVCVGLPFAAVQVCHAEQRVVFLDHRERDE